jgi:hypothetical protein
LPEIVQDIGAYAGLASVIGLAVLSALYFSQARDVRRLREWAGRAPERADEVPGAQTPVPGRVVAQPQTQAQSGPPAVPRAATPAGAKPATPAPVKAATPATAKPAAGGPAAPAGTTPATAKPASPSPATPAPVPAAGAAAAAVAAAAGAGASEARATPGSAQQGAGVATPDAPKDLAPAERPAGANEPASANGPATADKPATADEPDAPEGPSPPGAQPAARPGVPQPATAAGSRPPAVPPVPPAAPRPGVRPRPAPQQTEIIPPRREPWHQRLFGSTRNVLLAIAGVLVLGVGVAFALSQTSGDDGGADSGQQQSGGSAQAGGEDDGGDEGADGGTKRERTPIDPSTVTVAVLNGTMVPGLAAGVGTDVSEAGFELGTVANDETQGEQRAESVILYAQGNEREALAVGRKLGITQRQKIDPDTQALAGDAGVVVVVGQDRAP